MSGNETQQEDGTGEKKRRHKAYWRDGASGGEAFAFSAAACVGKEQRAILFAAACGGVCSEWSVRHQ